MILTTTAVRGFRFDSKRGFIESCRTILLWLGGALAIWTLSAALPASGVTLADLRAAKDLTPEGFMKYFRDFRFKLSRTVQQPNTFLASESGDCDDFATLAANVLNEKGYRARVVAVFMAKEVHVVCYVPECKCYLDYNCRKAASPLVKCEGTLASIAASVAQSFRADWRSASEVAFQGGSPRFVETEFH